MPTTKPSGLVRKMQRAAAAGLVRGGEQFPPRKKPSRHVPRSLVPAGTCFSVKRRRFDLAAPGFKAG